MNYVAGYYSMIQFSARVTRRPYQSCSFNRWVMAGIDRGATYQSRRMEREVVLLVQSPDIMKLGIEIARTARVRT